MLPYVDEHDFGSVFVQLMDGDDPVCYYIDDISNFVDKDPQRLEWFQFLPDKCVKKATEPFMVGQFSMKLSIHDVTKNG